MPLSRDELFAMLDRRLGDASLGAEQDRDIWRAAGVERAILVMDLSGFTRITRARGILHFLTVYRRAIGVVVAAIARHEGRVIKREADNVIASFARAGGALDAALDTIAEATLLDATLGEDDRVYPCFGVGYGRILELTDDVFGDEVNIAFKLGEDVAGRREILLSEGAIAQLSAEGRGASGAPDRIEVGGVSVTFRRVPGAALVHRAP